MSMKINDNHNENNNNEEDFFDNLMDDLINFEDDKSPSGEADQTPQEINENPSKSNDESIIEYVQKEIPPASETPKRSGLLNRIGASNANKESKGEEKDDSANEKTEQTPEPIISDDDKIVKNNDYYKNINKESSIGKSNSLLDRMKKRRQESELKTHGNDVFFQDKETLEELTQEEEQDKQEIIETIPVDDDPFDDMLEGLNDDTTEYVAPPQLNPDVEIPLETDRMNEVKVTADGKTLADMLIGMRSGRDSIIKKVANVRNQEEIAEIGNKKFSDDRYVKHVKVIDKETEENEKRIALSNKFLQKNASFTEQEKIIMKNLGLNSKELSKIMQSKKMTKKEKERVLSLGRYGAEKHFKGRRYRTTVGDTAMLEFLVKFKYANTRILRWLSNEPQGRTWRKLNRLRNSGLVESKTIIGIPDLWGATPSGIAISGYALNPGLRPMPKIPTIASDMGINYIAACLWFNSVNVLNLEDFPANNRVIALQDDGRDRVRGEMLVSELEIRSSLGKEINPASTTMRTLGDDRLYDVISSNVRESFEEWEAGGKIGDSPEFSLGNEYMWVLYPTSQLTLSYHVPDLIVKRERGPHGEPRSIAIEMERYEKTNDRYDKIMLAYKLDEHLYEKVVWLTPNTKVARALQKAAENVGFDRYAILPIITETGVYDKQDIWMI